jgi:hypothetical protein
MCSYPNPYLPYVSAPIHLHPHLTIPMPPAILVFAMSCRQPPVLGRCPPRCNQATLHHQTHAACSLTCWLQSGVTAMPLPLGEQEILDDLAGDAAVSAAEYDL